MKKLKNVIFKILVVSLILFSSSISLYNCGSFADLSPNKVTSFELENKVEEIVKQTTTNMGLSADLIPSELVPEYIQKTENIYNKLLRKMTTEGQNYITTYEIRREVHNQLDDFLYKAKNNDNSFWSNLFNWTFTNPPSSQHQKNTSYSSKKINYAGEICVICQNNYKNGERSGITSCGHVYHKDCIYKWLATDSRKSCPLCRKQNIIVSKQEKIILPQPIYQPIYNTNYVYKHQLDQTIVDVIYKLLGNKGIDTDKIPARVVAEYNEKVEKIIKIMKNKMSYNNRNYVTKYEIEQAAREELQSVLNKINYVDEICVICQDHYKVGERVGITSCGHIYHKDCIYPWLNSDKRKSCPLCRQENIIVSKQENVPYPQYL